MPINYFNERREKVARSFLADESLEETEAKLPKCIKEGIKEARTDLKNEKFIIIVDSHIDLTIDSWLFSDLDLKDYNLILRTKKCFWGSVDLSNI